LVRQDGATSTEVPINASGGEYAPAPQQTDDEQPSCGEPNYDSAIDTGLFIWESRCKPGTWQLRVTAGGEPRTYTGKLSADAPISGVTGRSLEVNDTLDLSDPRVVDFNLIINVANGEDGFEFQMPNSGEVCLSLQGPPGVPVLLGEAAAPADALPLDLRTLGQCGARLSYGEPAYDTSGPPATVLWEDATSGTWHLRVIGASSPKVLSYSGTLTNGEITNVKRVSFEANDQLSLSAGEVNYNMKVLNQGEDGFDFSFQPGTAPCLDTSGSPGQLLLGKSLAPTDGPLNLATLKACTSP
jgi:hypothetical protein